MAGEEEWARRIVEKELGRSVVVNDDGSEDGMYDLRIGPADAPMLAVECVRAIDRIRAETWSVGPSQGPLELALRGDWIIWHTSSARIKAIKKRLEPLLRELEDQGLSRFSVARVPTWHDTRYSRNSTRSALWSVRASACRAQVKLAL
jgi:hypothetical protein